MSCQNSVGFIFGCNRFRNNSTSSSQVQSHCFKSGDCQCCQTCRSQITLVRFRVRNPFRHIGNDRASHVMTSLFLLTHTNFLIIIIVQRIGFQVSLCPPHCCGAYDYLQICLLYCWGRLGFVEVSNFNNDDYDLFEVSANNCTRMTRSKWLQYPISYSIVLCL